MRLISWNINGIRAIHKKGALEWLRSEEYDILMFQEIKAESEQFPEEIKSGEFGTVFSDSA
ncbi:exodeoxyribonuclease III, partial [bacterium]|nr:exodeoxyribonuclease III [bacterium]